MSGEDHLTEWMKLQEEVNKEFLQILLRIDERLKAQHEINGELLQTFHRINERLRHIEHFVAMNSPIGPKEQEFKPHRFTDEELAEIAQTARGYYADQDNLI